MPISKSLKNFLLWFGVVDVVISQETFRLIQCIWYD